MEDSSKKSWNEQLKEWVEGSGKSITQISQNIGIPRSTLGDYMNGKTKEINNDLRRQQLYNLTNLECFKESYTPNISKAQPKSVKILTRPPRRRQPQESGLESKTHKQDVLSELKQVQSEILDIITDKYAGKATGLQKLKSHLLKAQKYQPTIEQRVEGIMELFDVLAEEVSYFRIADERERQQLVEKLKKEPGSFSYVNQIVNILYHGKSIDDWLLLNEPPHRIKKILKEREK